MREEFLDLLVQVALIGVYGAGALLVAAIGIAIEYYSYLYIVAGDYPLAAWLGAIGAIALLFSYLIVTDKLRGQVQVG